MTAARVPGRAEPAGERRLAELIRQRDWAATPIGAAETWPQSLRTALSICLESRFPILIWWGPELVMLYNDAYAPLIGAKHPQALGQRGAECFPEIWEIIGPMLAGVRERGDATWSDDQLLVLERNGFPEECYFTFSYSPIRDESGEVGGVFTAVAETTAHVIGERQLAILRDLAAATGTARSAAEVCTRAAETLSGSVAVPFSLAYLFADGRSVARLAASGDVGSGEARVAPPLVALAADEPRSWPLAAVAAGAEEVLVEDIEERFAAAAARAGPTRSAIVLPLTYGTSEPVGALVLGLNDRRPLDDSYLAFLRLIARQVAAAIGDAAAYEEAERRAEALAELDRAKTRFFTNVSHEFRTPLTLILSPLEDLLAQPELLRDGDAGRQLRLVRRNALRLLRLVNALLDFSRAQSGRVDALFQPTDLAAVTADLASSFRSAIETAGLKLVVDCAPLPEPIYVDREAWEKIVLNLLSNALKFTFAGEIELRLRLEGDGVALRVRDTGVGIPPAELPHLFERFHRVRDVRARSHEGSGIGLALVQELARLHGGDVAVQSALGAGSAFTVTLPRGSAHLPSDRVGGPEGTATRGLGAAPYVEEALRWLPEDVRGDDEGEQERPLRDDLVRATGIARSHDAAILIADDNTDMRAYLARLLRRYWRVETVADGAAALESVRRSRPDLVLADVMMPGLDGFELLRALRADVATSSIPVVLLSARAGPDSAVEGLDAGADDYLVKPFSAPELVARVRANLELSRLRADVARLRAVAEERVRAERVLMTLPDGVCTVDADGVVGLWNPAAFRITGLPRSAVTGLPVEQALPGWQELAARVAARTGQSTIHPLEVGGRELWLSVVSAPYAGGTLYGFRDASGEAAFEQMRRDLVTTVSHELRTPVSSIYGAVATLARSDVAIGDEIRRELTELLHEQTERLALVVDDLVTVSSLDSGELTGAPRECDVLALAARVAERAQKRCPANLTVRQSHPEAVAPLAVDEDKLEQILETLLDNAIRYSPDGGEILFALETRPGAVRFSVRDPGIGIAGRHHDHIGEKFYRADPEQQRGVPGLGLGLYICRQLLTLLGGRLWFESSEGAGSTFYVEVPGS